MKILVGILYCGEQEYQECLRAIEKQTFQNFDHFVIENLPNKEAHDSLYAEFMKRSDSYDLFVKVDADMVLSRDTFFEEVIAEMNDAENVDNLQIGVHDHFTDSMIYGLHIYRSSVTWSISNENSSIFVDRIENIKNRRNDNVKLAPAADHAPNPSLFHAYHFGIHKGIKIIQPGEGHFNMNSSLFHYSNIIKTYINYQKTQREALLYAIEGFNDVVELNLTPKHVDYGNEYVKGVFDSKKIDSEITIAKFKRNLYLHYPSFIRYDLFMLSKNKNYNWRTVLRNLRNKEKRIKNLTK